MVQSAMMLCGRHVTCAKNVWVVGKTAWFLVSTCHIWAPQRGVSNIKRYTSLQAFSLCCFAVDHTRTHTHTHDGQRETRKSGVLNVPERRYGGRSSRVESERSICWQTEPELDSVDTVLVQSTVMMFVSFNAPSSRVAIFPWRHRRFIVVVVAAAAAEAAFRRRFIALHCAADWLIRVSRSPLFTYCRRRRRRRSNRIPIYRTTPVVTRWSGIARPPGSRSAESCRCENEVKTRRAANKWTREPGIDFEPLTNVVGQYDRRRWPW